MPCFRIDTGLDRFIIFGVSVACFVVCGALFVGHMPADTDGPRFRLILPDQIVDCVSALGAVNVKWTRPVVLIHGQERIGRLDFFTEDAAGVVGELPVDVYEEWDVVGVGANEICFVYTDAHQWYAVV